MKAFCDLPDKTRFRIREALEALGAHIAGYYGGGVQLALPRHGIGAVHNAAQDAGLIEKPGSRCYFPLGSDTPPDSLRHDGSYPGSRGFWAYVTYEVGPELQGVDR